MNKKLLSFLFLICIFLFCTVLNCQAFISDKSDLQNSVDKLNQLANFDCISLINKNELIGYRLNSFEMLTSEYQRNVIAARDNIVQGLNKIDIIENSTDFSDSEKEMQVRQIYNNADYILSDLNSKTINYIMSLSNSMPTITYQRYQKKFQEYYNNLNLTNNELK